MQKTVEFLGVLNFDLLIWICFFSVGFIFFIYSIVSLIIRRKRGQSSIAKSTAISFISNWILYIPCELFGDYNYASNAIRVIESVATALLKSFNIYFGDGYERVFIETAPVFSGIYTILRVVVNIELLLLAAGFVLNFFEGPVQKLRFHFKRRNYTYIFSECNEKTLMIASTLPERIEVDSEKKKYYVSKKSIIFTCSSSEITPDMVVKISKLGGICLDESVSNVVANVRNKSLGVEVFLLNEKEETNICQLEKLCDVLKATRGAKIKIFSELHNSPWGMFDDFQKRYQLEDRDDIQINLIRAEENFAYNHLLKNSIFSSAIEREGYREIKVVLAGMNECTLEIMKTMLHLSQMPGYRLSMLILDEGCGLRRLKMLMPDIFDRASVEGDSVYSIDYRENVDFETDDFEISVAEKYKDFTYAFISKGGDIENFSIANRLKILSLRNGWGEKNIKVCAWEPEIFSNIAKSKLNGIEFVRSKAELYSYDSLTNSPIERVSIAIHDLRHQGKVKWNAYSNNEYNRHSVYARTLSLKHKIWVIEQFFDSEYELITRDVKWKMYEHMRWNVYTRTMGFVVAPQNLVDSEGRLDKKIRDSALVHTDLVPFDELPKDVQARDGLAVSDKIVEALKSV